MAVQVQAAQVRAQVTFKVAQARWRFAQIHLAVKFKWNSVERKVELQSNHLAVGFWSS